MSNDFLMLSANDYDPDINEDIMSSIFNQYEKVIIESLITSFGLDVFIKDRYGGDVDTIHNVREIGSDPNMVYKNKRNYEAYMQNGDYNSSEYHSHKDYIKKNREVSKQKKDGVLRDEYTGEIIKANGKSDLDHVISAKEIHEDRGRVLSGLKGSDLANSDENLCATNPHTNRTKKASSMDDFLDKYGDEYTDEQKNNMKNKDKISRKSYEHKLAKAYYTSPAFAKDLTLATGSIGIKMGARQALGLVFSEIWFAVKEEITRYNKNYDFSEMLSSIKEGVQKGFENAKGKYKEVLAKFKDGAIAGVLSSITTTLCNIFFTTAKNTVNIIRQTYASIVEATKILFINPDNLLFGERMKAAVKVIATGASVVVGSIVSEMVSKTSLGLVPVLGDVVQTFCGVLVSGIMSCTLLYFLDRSELVKKLVKVLDKLPSISKDVDYFKKQAVYFERYAAELMQIDIDKFRKETQLFNEVVEELGYLVYDGAELNKKLKELLNLSGVKIPWEGKTFDDFMKDKNSKLVFE